MAKVKKAQNLANEVLLKLDKITDDNLTAVFHLEAFDKGQLDPKTVEVIRERVRIYLQQSRYDLYALIDSLNP